MTHMATTQPTEGKGGEGKGESRRAQQRARRDAFRDMEMERLPTDHLAIGLAQQMTPTKSGPGWAAEGLGNKGWASHKGHGHAATQAARARCRREQRSKV